MQTVVQAQVSKRLLTKASRLFTGTLDGRIIEIIYMVPVKGHIKPDIVIDKQAFDNRGDIEKNK